MLRRVLTIALIGAAVAPAMAHATPGDLDGSYSEDGFALVGYREAGLGPELRVVMDGTGRALVADGSELHRFLGTGQVDRHFGNRGSVTSLPISPVADMAVDRDGSIVIAGRVDSSLAVARLTASGEPDRGFGDEGLVTLDVSGTPYPGTENAEAVAIQDDGRIVVAGTRDVQPWPGPPATMVVARLDRDGALDQSFSEDGLVSPEGGGVPETVVLDESGRIHIGGGFRGYPGVMRLSGTGQLDPSFGEGGTAAVPIPADSSLDRYVRRVVSLAIGEDGDVVAAIELPQTDALVRFDVDGTQDSGIGKAGVLALKPIQAVGGVALDGRGHAIVAGSSARDLVLMRLDPALTLDRSFAGDGIAVTDFHHRTERAPHLTMDRGRPLVAATAGGQPLLARHEVGPGKPDRDADGRADRRDLCPSRYATGRLGCLVFRRSVTISSVGAGRPLFGAVRSRSPACRLLGHVRVFRREQGRDPNVGSAYIDEDSTWRLRESMPRGTYYASIARIVRPRLGICRATRSDLLAVR